MIRTLAPEKGVQYMRKNFRVNGVGLALEGAPLRIGECARNCVCCAPEEVNCRVRRIS